MICVNGILRQIIVALTLVCLCGAHVDMETYHQMPPLYAADDYRECLQQTSASYCMVYTEIQPDNNSLVWQQITDFHNSVHYHYRHDQLYRGVCTSKCKEYSKSDSNTWDASAVQPKSANGEMSKILHAISRKQKTISQYELQMHECVNDEMKQKYNLSVKTFVNYCDNPTEPIEKGPWYTYTILIIIGIGVMNVLSTLYDYHLNSRKINGTANPNYYNTNHKNAGNKYLTSFSLYRNYRRLVVPNNSAIGKDLRFVDGFRTLMSMTIVLEHVVLIQFMHLNNPGFLEYMYSTDFIRSAMHIVVCIELFFVMSGLMLYIKFSKSVHITATSSLKECVTVYVRMMISRYLRYMPSLLFLILFSSNILIHLQNAPFWRHVIEPTVVLCRSNWWSNLFMTANLGVNKNCWMHTWYIAGDFQLYAIFLVVLVIAAKYPQYKKYVYTTVGIIGVILPSIFIYMKSLVATPTILMEDYRHMYLQNIVTGQNIYLNSFANLNGFFFGILSGELYMKYLKDDKYKRIVERYLKPLPLFGWSIIFAIWYLGSQLLFKEPSIWTALFPILFKPVSLAIVVTIVVLLKMCQGDGFLTWPIFRVLARISYQVYLWHLVILFAVFGKAEQPMNVSFLTIGILHIGIYVLAAIASFFIAIMVEYPIAELLTIFDLKSKGFKTTSG